MSGAPAPGFLHWWYDMGLDRNILDTLCAVLAEYAGAH